MAYTMIGLSSCGTSLDDFEFHVVARSNIRKVSNAEAVSIASAINNAEISASRTVEGRLTRAKVKALARQIFDAHSSSNLRLAQLSPQEPSRIDPVASLLREQSWVAVRWLSATSAGQLDATYVVSELKTQAQALTLINCVLATAGRDGQLGVLMDQLQASVETDMLTAIELRQELALADKGEALVVGCLAMCAPHRDGGTPSISEAMRAAICVEPD